MFLYNFFTYYYNQKNHTRKLLESSCAEKYKIDLSTKATSFQNIAKVLAYIFKSWNKQSHRKPIEGDSSFVLTQQYAKRSRISGLYPWWTLYSRICGFVWTTESHDLRCNHIISSHSPQTHFEVSLSFHLAVRQQLLHMFVLVAKLHTFKGQFSFSRLTCTHLNFYFSDAIDFTFSQHEFLPVST